MTIEEQTRLQKLTEIKAIEDSARLQMEANERMRQYQHEYQLLELS